MLPGDSRLEHFSSPWKQKVTTVFSIDCSHKQAAASFDGQILRITTGRMERRWEWTQAGFATRQIIDIPSGLSWQGRMPGCDWQLPTGDEPDIAVLKSLSADVQNDEGFTSDHVCVVAEIDYPESGVSLQWTVWAYPGASGLRTQLAALRTAPPTDEEISRHRAPRLPARVSRVPLRPGPHRRRWIGYHSGTQQRNDTHQDLLKEEVVAHPLMGTEWCDWASAACVEEDAGGIVLVKESHKCVAQPGHDTGGFICDETEGLSCTGWGLLPEELSSEQFTSGWATWCLVWGGGDLERQCAFKTFDGLRYPIDPARDIYIQANTWGSTPTSSEARRAACQDRVLEELESCAQLGIDVLQIDDGWQSPPGHPTGEPGANGWRPHPESWPNGWAPLRSRAEELAMRLGLWAAAVPISLEELRESHEQAGFVQYKLDFADLRNRQQIDRLMTKVRDFIQQTGHRVRVNWDLTEIMPRYGYFFAREYGCVYLENRKPFAPISTVYRPHTVLRDLWQVSRYLNLHRFQCSIQNVDRVDHRRSDAHQHSHAYSVAIALMGIPLFFQETKLYTSQARNEIAPLLDIYKQHREHMYRGIVHPIGAKPDNASWTGFQCHLPEENVGYLTIFRERCNPDAEQDITLGWLKGGTIELTDLRNQTTNREAVGADGRVLFRIDSAPDFLFLRYAR